MPLIRYLIIARAVFGELFYRFASLRFAVDGELAGACAIKVVLPAGPLDEYAAEQAGLVDLLGDAKIWLNETPISIILDFDALAAAEDQTLGPRLPRRARPISN